MRVARHLLLPVLWGSTFALLLALRRAGVDLVVASAVVWTALLVVLVVLERVLPFDRRWHRPDDQLANDVVHTLLGSALGSRLGGVVADASIAALASTASTALWSAGPALLPIPAQVALGFLIVDGVRWLQHRASHSVRALWETHKLHHDPRRLLAIKAGRSHVFDRAMQALCVVPLVVVGADSDVVFWCVALNSAAGLIAHANIDAPSRGWLFVGPAQHRVHHRRIELHNNLAAEHAAKNFGAALTLWDRLAGTFVVADVRDVGLAEDTPSSVVAQIGAPVHAWLDGLSGQRP